MYPDAQEKECFRESCVPIAALLRQNPCQHSPRVVDSLLEACIRAPDPTRKAGLDMSNPGWLNGTWNLDDDSGGLFGDWMRDPEVGTIQCEDDHTALCGCNLEAHWPSLTVLLLE